jgi:hypothetical protein
MGVPASQVGYTIATTGRENTKVHKNMWWHWGGGGEKKNKGYCKWRPKKIFYHISLNASQNEKLFGEMWRKSKHTSYVLLFFSENCGVYEIMWKGWVQPDRPQVTI